MLVLKVFKQQFFLRFFKISPTQCGGTGIVSQRKPRSGRWCSGLWCDIRNLVKPLPNSIQLLFVQELVIFHDFSQGTQDFDLW